MQNDAKCNEDNKNYLETKIHVDVRKTQNNPVT